ncbi:integrin beta, partial [Plakobranchus ocellatus]
MRRSIIGFFILVALPTGVTSVCSGSTCEECIFSDPSCGWCSQKDFTSERCQPYSSLQNAGCVRGNIAYPASTFSKIQDEEVRDSSLSDQAIQVQPQFIRITTRPRKKETFTLTFRAARNYPVDLYFLFDSSLSMETHILSLASLASDIGRSIANISSNYRMAYGIFQDKVILPYTDTTPVRVADPCLAITDRNCSPPFEFKHLLDMTKDVIAFEKVVEELKLTGNIDKPEGSLDAIMQAVTCTEKIGWRKGSRKLLIFASNDRFHIAGDGKLAGILVPNDGECHLDTNGDYTMELLQDYPSIGQLTDIVDKKEVHIIFAVTDDQLPLFNELSKRIPHSTVELLAESGSGNKDIRQIIEKKYREMISEVEMIYTSVEGVDIKIKAKSSICERQDSNICKGIEIGDSVDFDVEVRVMSCPAEGGDKKKTVDIYPGSLSTDKLTVEIITECDCDCTTDKTTWEQNSPLCSDGNGTLICGQCVCNQGRFGQNCECDATDTDTVYSGCLDPKNNSTGTECSGSGTCICGVCYCNEGFSGPYCECNDENCGLFEGKLCGGAKGKCQCGKCVCDPDYIGDTCGCKNSNKSCLSNGKLCSGNGICQCDKCVCDTGYSETHCEKCV